jgi:hypothetical protein
VRLIIFGNRLELVPVRDIREARGFLKGMSSDINCDEEDAYKFDRRFRNNLKPRRNMLTHDGNIPDTVFVLSLHYFPHCYAL